MNDAGTSFRRLGPLAAIAGLSLFGTGCEVLVVGGIVGIVIWIALGAGAGIMNVVVHRSAQKAQQARLSEVQERMGALPLEIQTELMERMNAYSDGRLAAIADPVARAFAWEEFVTEIVTKAEKQVHKERMRLMDRRIDALPKEIREVAREKIMMHDLATMASISNHGQRRTALEQFVGANLAASESGFYLPHRLQPLSLRIKALPPDSQQAVWDELGLLYVQTLCEISDPRERSAASAEALSAIVADAEARAGTAPAEPGRLPP